MKRNSNFLMVWVLVMGLVLVACGSKLTPENFAKVKNGMSEEEVKEILGKPDEVESGEVLGLTSTTYTYDDQGGFARIGFINGNVATKHYTTEKE